jgi:hypothetical protein
VVDFSSGEEDAFLDTSCDEEITQKHFDDLNCGLLRPPGDGNVIILTTPTKKKRRCTRMTAPTPMPHHLL